MNAVKLLPQYTYADYCQWEGRWELIEGIPFAMSPAPNMKHQWIGANIIYEFKKAIKDAKCNTCKVYEFIDIKVEEDTILQPDCSIICKPTKKNFLDFPPALVVEILSEQTALKDRITKFNIYEKFGIPYYVIADPEKELAEIYLLVKRKYKAQTFSPDEKFKFNFFPGCEIAIKVKDFYE